MNNNKGYNLNEDSTIDHQSSLDTEHLVDQLPSEGDIQVYDANQDLRNELITFGGFLPVDSLSTIFSFPIATITYNTIDWDRLLSSDNILKLIYKLRVISNVISTTTSQYADQSEIDLSKKWCSAFFVFGGIQHLLKLLMTLEIKANESSPVSRLNSQCLSILLYLLTYFLCPLENQLNKTTNQMNNNNYILSRTSSSYRLGDSSYLDGEVLDDVNTSSMNKSNLVVVEAIALNDDDDDDDDITIQSNFSHVEPIPAAYDDVIVPTTASVIERPHTADSNRSVNPLEMSTDTLNLSDNTATLEELSNSLTFEKILQDSIGDHRNLMDRILKYISILCIECEQNSCYPSIIHTGRSSDSNKTTNKAARHRNGMQAARHENYFKSSTQNTASSLNNSPGSTSRRQPASPRSPLGDLLVHQHQHQQSISQVDTGLATPVLSGKSNKSDISLDTAATIQLPSYPQNNINHGDNDTSDMTSDGNYNFNNNNNSDIRMEIQSLQNCLSLLCLLLQFDVELLPVLLSTPGFINNLMYMILKSTDVSLRSFVSRTVGRLCRLLYLRGLVTAVVEVLNILIPAIKDTLQYSTSSTEFYQLLLQLVSVDNIYEHVDMDALIIRISDIIIEQPVIEITEEDTDFVLKGLLSLLREILANLPITQQEQIKRELQFRFHLLDELFYNCLFSSRKSNLQDELQYVGEEGKNGSVSSSTSTYDQWCEYPKRTLPKCKNANTREEALALIVELCTPCADNFNYVLQLVGPHHYFGSLTADGQNFLGTFQENDKMGRLKKGSVNNSSVTSSNLGSPSKNANVLAMKSKTGYVGLVNPGCICYINSTLQQFYMIPAFRKGILQLEAQRQVEDEDNQENLLFQLQLLFLYLQESEKAYCDPRGFCTSFKDIDGNSTDLLSQQDASEFVTNFLDRIETTLKGTRQEHLLANVFGGKISNELDSHGNTVHHSERIEEFYYLSVSIKKGQVNTLQDSLLRFISGETVDYTWEKTLPNGQVIKEALPTIKSSYLLKLPEHLIIHLMRYEFDLQTMQQIKINDRFEFPLYLDMYPYTKEGHQQQKKQQQSNGNNGNNNRNSDGKLSSETTDETAAQSGYLYKLSGVVVHLGTANSGHYYSYIRERSCTCNRSLDKNTNGHHANEQTEVAPDLDRAGVCSRCGCLGNGRDKWYEFNDAFVGEFDIEDLDDETFGGEDEGLGGGGVSPSRTWGGGGMVASRSQSRLQSHIDNNNNNSSSSNNTSGNRQSSFRQKTRNAFILIYDKIHPNLQQQHQLEVQLDTSAKSPFRRKPTAQNLNSTQQPLSVPGPYLGSVSSSNNLMTGNYWKSDRKLDSKTSAAAVTIGAPGAGAGADTDVNNVYHRYRASVVSKDLIKIIEQDNSDFWRRKYIFDSKYYSFMSSLLTLGVQHHQKLQHQSSPTQLQHQVEESLIHAPETVQCAIKFALGTLVIGREKQLVHNWCKQLSVVLRESTKHCEWLLNELAVEEDTSKLKYLLLDVEDKDIRYAVTQILSIAVYTLSSVTDKHLEDYYNVSRLHDNDDDDDDAKKSLSSCASVQFVHSMMILLKDAQIAWRRISFFFNPLLTFAEGGIRQRYYVIDRGYLLLLMSFFLGSDTLYPELIWGKEVTNEKLRQMGDGYNYADMRSLLSLLLELTRACSMSQRDQEYPNPLEPRVEMSRKEQHLFESPVFFYKLLKQIRAPSRKRLVWPVMERIVFGSKPVTNTAIDMIINSIRKEDLLELKAPWRAAILLAQLADCHQDWRVRTLVPRLIQEMQTSTKFVYATEISVVMLLRLIKSSDLVRQVIYSNRTTLRWLDLWLQARKAGTFPPQSTLLKYKRSNSSNKNEKPMPPQYTGLQATIKVVGGTNGIGSMLGLLRRVASGESIDDTYDSDDEPSSLVGRRVKVRWSEGKWYCGTVTSYNDSADTHEVYYDDGDRKTYRMVEKTWELIADRQEGTNSVPSTSPSAQYS